MRQLIWWILLFFGVMLESSITTTACVLVLLLFLRTLTKGDWIFFAAVVTGMCLDLLLLRPMGVTSVFLLLVLSIMWLYERKFETTSLPFLFFFSLLVTFCYYIFFVHSYSLLQALLAACVLTIIFFITSHFTEKRQEYVYIGSLRIASHKLQ